MIVRSLAGALVAVLLGAASPSQLGAQQHPASFETQFDNALGTDQRVPPSLKAVYTTDLERRVASVADGSNGRIGVAAVDLSTGQMVSVLGDQRFPMASTSKIAIAATFMQGVEDGRWSLNDSFPMLYPVRSKPFSSKVAPVREGERLPATRLIELMITRSNNYAADALLRVVGGPEAVDKWVHRAGISNFNMTRDILTLVRDDGEFDPANHIDNRDSATPKAMVTLLAGLYQGRWLSAESRKVILGAMSRTVTGRNRMKYLIPTDAKVLHKTGSLHDTCSDVGLIETPDGRTLAVAVYVTGQRSRGAREQKIAMISRAIYDGYAKVAPERHYASADYGGK